MDQKSGRPLIDTVYRFAGPAKLVSVGGHYTDAQFDMDIAELPGTPSERDLTGLLNVNGTKLNFKGHRSWSRGMVKPTDARNNAEAGTAIIVWTPSPDWVKGAKEDHNYPPRIGSWSR